MFFSGCVVNTGPFEPKIDFYPSPRVTERLPSPFPPLSPEEREEEWGKELYLGLHFAHEFDLYRAITCYKRALFLCPDGTLWGGDFFHNSLEQGKARSKQSGLMRRAWPKPCSTEEDRAGVAAAERISKKITAPQYRTMQIEYHIAEAYFMGCKYKDVIETYELGSLTQAPLDFPVLKELLLMLIDSYTRLDSCEKAERIKWYLESIDPLTEAKMEEYQAINSADFSTLYAMAVEDEDLACFLSSYQGSCLSVKKAQTLNAILPGAGFYYVGQTKTAVTAFVINALFTYAAYQFFDRGYVAAGLITTSLEMGWYLGGINGAGLAAQEHNEHNWNVQGKEFLIRKRLFPLLMFQYAF
jgi:hypothetical protein